MPPAGSDTRDRHELERNLGENWRSAQCVSSLYDAYVDTKKENENLQREINQLQDSRDTLRSRLKVFQEQYDVESCTVPEHKIAELEMKRMTRESEENREKLANERNKCAIFQEKLMEMTQKYEKQLQVYHDKFSIDPNEAKRVELAVETLQNTLDQVIHEKQLVETDFNVLRQEHSKALNSKMQTDLEVVDLRLSLDHTRRMKVKQALSLVHRRFAVVAQSKALARWKRVTEVSNIERRTTLMAQSQLKEMDQQKMAMVLARLLRSTSHRVFRAWSALTRETVQRRETLFSLLIQRVHAWKIKALVQWRDRVQYLNHRSKALKRVLRTRYYLSLRFAVRNWISGVNLLEIDKIQTECDQIQEELEAEKQMVLDKEKSIAELAKNCHVIQSKLDATIAEHTELVTTMEEAGSALRCKVVHNIMKIRRTRTLATMFLEWKDRSQQTARLRRVGQKFMENSRCGRLKLGVSVWTEYAKEKKRHTALLRRFVGTLRLRGVAMCMHSWKDFVAERRHQHQIMRSFLAKLQHQGILRVFMQWKSFCQWRNESRELWGSVFETLEMYHIRDTFEHWKNQLDERARQQHLIHRARRYIFRLKNQSKGSAFSAWKELVQIRRRERYLMNRVFNRLVNHNIFTAFQKLKWHFHDENKHELEMSVKDLQEKANTLQVTLLERDHEFQELQAKYNVLVLKYGEELDGLQKEREKLTQKLISKVVSTMVGQSLSYCFQTWKTDARKSIRERRVLKRFVDQWQGRRVTIMFESWRQYTKKNVHSRRLVRRFISKWKMLEVAGCFASWNDVIRQKKVNRIIIQRMVDRMRSSSRARCFTTWKCFVDDRTTARQVLNPVLVILSRIQLRGGFVNWKASQLQDELAQQRRDRQRRQVFYCWKEFVRQNKILAAFVMRMRFQGASRMFSTWMDFVAEKKHQRELAWKVFNTMANRRVTLSFDHWKRYNTYMVQKELQDMKDEIERMKHASNAAEEKRKLNLIRKFASQLRFRQTALCFSSWAEYSATAKHERSVVARCVARLRNKSVLNCFTAWKGDYLARQHEKMVLRKFVFQLQNRSQTSAFRSWSAFIDRRRFLRSFFQKQDGLRLIRSGLYQWRDCIGYLKHCDEVQRKALILLSKRNIESRFLGWKKYTQEMVHQRRIMRMFVDQMQGKNKSYSFEKWRKYVSNRREQRCVTIRILLMMGKRKLRSAFSKWHRSSQFLIEQTLEKKVKQLEQEKRQWKKLSDELKQKLSQKEAGSWKVFLRLMTLQWSHRAVAVTFNAWKDYSHTRIHRTGKMTTLQCWHRWRTLIFLTRARRTSISSDFTTLQSLVRQNIIELSSVQTITSLCATISRLLPHPTETSAALLYLYDKKNRSFWSITPKKRAIVVDASTGFLGTVFETHKSLLCENVMKDPRYDAQVDQLSLDLAHRRRRVSCLSMYCVPILSKDKVCGIIQIVRQEQRVSSESMLLAAMSSYQIEIQLKNIPSSSSMEEIRQLYRKTRIQEPNDAFKKKIHRLQERLFEKQAELEDAKDALVDQQHSQRTRDIVMLASPTNQQAKMNLETPGTNRREGILTAQVSNMKNELTRAEADNVFLSNAVQSAVQHQGNIPDTMYREVMRICDRIGHRLKK